VLAWEEGLPPRKPWVRWHNKDGFPLYEDVNVALAADCPHANGWCDTEEQAAEAIPPYSTSRHWDWEAMLGIQAKLASPVDNWRAYCALLHGNGTTYTVDFLVKYVVGDFSRTWVKYLESKEK
jgi:hypothetical protein